MDTYKLSQRWTLIAGLRATWNTNPVNQHDLFARPAGSFLDMSHDSAQPLSGPSRPICALSSPRRRSSVGSRARPRPTSSRNTMALHAGGGIFNDIIPAQVADLGATNPPYAPVFVGGINGQVGGIGIAPGVPSSAVDATAQANQSFQAAFRSNAPISVRGQSEHLPHRHAEDALLSRVEPGPRARRLGPAAPCASTTSARAPCRSRTKSSSTATRPCAPAALRPSPSISRSIPASAASTSSAPARAATTPACKPAVSKQFAGLTVRANYTFSHCIDEVSNGGLLPFSSLGILSPLPGSLRPEYGNCDYDVRHNFSAFVVYEMPFRSSHALLRGALEGWQVSGTAILHSGLPFSVLSAPYTANNNGIFQGSGPQFANRVPIVSLYRKTPAPGITQPGSLQWLNPDAFASVVDPSIGACAGGDSSANCQFGDSGRNSVRGPHFTYSEVYVTKRIPIMEHVTFRFDTQFFNVFNHPNFALPANQAGTPGEPATQTGFGALTSTISPPTGLLGVGLGGDSSPRMIAFQGRVEF